MPKVTAANLSGVHNKFQAVSIDSVGDHDDPMFTNEIEAEVEEMERDAWNAMVGASWSDNTQTLEASDGDKHIPKLQKLIYQRKTPLVKLRENPNKTTISTGMRGPLWSISTRHLPFF
jgi:hypothetical protein